MAVAFAVLGGAATYVLIISTSLHGAPSMAAEPLPAQSGVINTRTADGSQATQAPASRPPQIPLFPEAPPSPPLIPFGPVSDGPVVAGGGPAELYPNLAGPDLPVDLPMLPQAPGPPPDAPPPPQAPEAPAPAAVVFVPTCWGVKTPVVAVGEAGEIELDISSCQTGPLPTSIFAALASASADVSVAGPIDGTREEAAQSWTSKINATKAGRHDLTFAVYPAGLESYTIKTPIIVSEAEEADDGGDLMKALSTSNSALSSLAGGLASLVTIVTTLGTIIALRRTRSKKAGDGPAAAQSGDGQEAPDDEPPSDDDAVASLGTSAGRSIGRTRLLRRYPRSRP